MRDFIPLNFTLMSNPWNWIIVTLMVLLPGFGLALVASMMANPTPDKT